MKVLHQVRTVSALWSLRVILAALLGSALLTKQAAAWGNEGHQIIADIAEQYLEPVALASLRAILDEDHDGLTANDIADEAMWADRYPDLDRNGSRERYERTRHWHFVDIELDRPNLDLACFGHPRLPAGVPASSGPAEACIVDKIDQFAAELGNSGTDPEERLVALKFVLHLVGDVHQPLHTADDHDAGGNGRQVRAGGLGSGKLHHFWDIEFVERLGPSPAETAARLIAGISDEQR